MSRRIVVISEDLVEPWDEGIKKFTVSVAEALRRHNEVLLLNVDRGAGAGRTGGPAVHVPGTRTFISTRLRRAIRRFDPDVTLYVPSPSSTLASFARAFALRRHQPRAQLGMVALIPRRHPALLRPILQGSAPDVVFVPSYRSLLYLYDAAVPGEVLPVGIDPAVFHPVVDRDGERRRLREKYDVAPEATVYLHVGHLSPRRNLRALGPLAAGGAQVIVVGSTSTPQDRAVRAGLEAAGVRVIREVVPVEEFYRLADAYVFPVRDSEGCVEIPLSVVEALACGLPVLAYPFGGLRDVLPPGDDLRYWENESELAAAAAALRANGDVRARDMGSFSWDRIAEHILTTLDGRDVS